MEERELELLLLPNAREDPHEECAVASSGSMRAAEDEGSDDDAWSSLLRV